MRRDEPVHMMHGAREHYFSNGSSLKIRATTLLTGTALLGGLYLTSRYSYLLFHMLAELISILIAFGIFIFAWHLRRFLDNRYFLFLGIAFLFVGGFDLVHALAYKGMGIFEGYGANLPTQLWIAARAVESLSLFIAPFLLGRNIKPAAILAAFVAVSTVLLWSIFYSKAFPVCYVEGEGLTLFKKVSEYVICLVLLLSGVLLTRKRASFEKEILQLVLLFIGATIVSELAFTYYIGVNDLSNMVGHMCKIIAFYLMYVAILKTGLVKPYNLVFRDLKKREEELAVAKDDLEKQVTERTAELVRINEELEQEISGHIRAKDELTEYKVHLEEMVMLRTAELEAANSELEASYKDMESFSYTTSHDLREPLLIIDWSVKRFLKHYEATLDDNGKEMLFTIRDTAEKMEQLINDLLSFSRMSTRNVQRTEIDMTVLVKDVFRGMESLAPGRKVSLEVTDLPRVFGDPSMIRQVVVNLMSNAIKYSRPKEAATIEVGGEEREEDHVYYVRDNGMGFSAEQTDRLFGFFQRLHEGKGIDGTGIGLMIIKKIIEKHCGTVWAEGNINKGATFYFSLPKQPPY